MAKCFSAGVFWLSAVLPAVAAGQMEPVHVWHFDEAEGDLLLDASDDPVDLELFSGAKRVKGRFGMAVQTGNGGYAQGPGLGAMDSGALECWVKSLEPCGGGQFGIVGFGNRYGHRNDKALLGVFPGPEPDAPLRCGWGVHAGGWRGVSTAAPAPGSWVHLVANWSPMGAELFVNGRLVAREDLALRVPEHEAVYLGTSSWGRTAAMIVDEVRVYARPVSAEAVARHFADASYVAHPPQPPRRIIRYGAAGGAVRNVADFHAEGSMTSGIQEAVDALPRLGGEVYVPPGVYLLQRSIWLRDKVTLRGAGAATILRRPVETATGLTAAAAAGESVVQIEEPAAFRVGQDVSIYSNRARGWHSTTAPVVAIDGNTLRLARGLNHPVDPAEGAAANNAFPMITAEDRRNIQIRDLTIDGGVEPMTEGVHDFTWAAIHLVNCIDSHIEGCSIRHYPADGISVQRGHGGVVTGNRVENCRGHGMHPGTGLTDSLWTNNIARGNRGDGLFFCMYVRHSVVSNNILVDNGGHGVGHLGGGGDKYNVVSNNTCVRNGTSGIHAFDGSDNVITGNICLNNSQRHPGRWPGIAVIRTTDSVISNNRCLDDQAAKTQAAGIVESDESDFNMFFGNQARGNLGPGLTVTGANSQRSPGDRASSDSR